MDKAALKKELLKLIETELHQSSQDYKRYHAASMVDRSEPVDIDDQSQAGQAAELAEAIGADSQNVSDKMNFVEGLDFGPKTFAEEGAVVTVGKNNYVVAVSTPRLQAQRQELCRHLGPVTHLQGDGWPWRWRQLYAERQEAED